MYVFVCGLWSACSRKPSLARAAREALRNAARLVRARPSPLLLRRVLTGIVTVIVIATVIVTVIVIAVVVCAVRLDAQYSEVHK